MTEHRARRTRRPMLCCLAAPAFGLYLSAHGTPAPALLRDRRGSERRDRVDDLGCGHNGTRVVRDIDLESGVHLVIRVIRCRIFYHRDLVAKLGCITNGRLNAGMRDQPDDDELMNTMLL